MNNPIDEMLSDAHQGSTTLFVKAIQYLLTLNEDKLKEVKTESQRLAHHFISMGLFQKLDDDSQKIHSFEDCRSICSSIEGVL